MIICRICHSSFELGSWSMLFSLTETDPICRICSQALEVITGELCVKCGRSLSNLNAEFRRGDCCYDCIRWQEDKRWGGILEKNRSLYSYNDHLKEVMALYKFRGDHDIIFAFRQSFRKEFRRQFHTADVVVPIPLSAERLYERGFNQSLILAEFLNLPISEMLSRKHLEKQSKKSRHERIASENVFQLKSNENVLGKKVVLIDDIYTTGATIRQAAEVLKLAGANTISSFTLARG